MIKMKKILINYGGYILFYLVIVLGAIFVSYDSNYMQHQNTNIIASDVVNQ